ncbi:MAG: hypothetical protein JXK94_07935 [Deltaproteobacteria bacterium]|nr:hypothetical protein [Deltaproteobacteria bacterium]
MSVKKILVSLLGITLTVLFLGSGYCLAETATQKVKKYAETVLTQLAADPAIVKAVVVENAKNKSLDDIKKLDEKWIASDGIPSYVKERMDSPMGKHLAGIRDTQYFFKEIFLMDNQGALVALSDKTSDYWQGDEKKFQRPFQRNAVFVDDVSFDKSAKAFLAHVNVPVKDKGVVVGVITFGIDMDIFWMTPM